MTPLRLHIGHHFYGSGNLGDDLMLAGFLSFLQSTPAAPHMELTACSMFDLAPLRLRFPAVRWHPYTPAGRDALIAAADLWLGLGDSPFQTTSGPWFLDHLAADLALCQRHRKPMFFLGVGVNDAPALAHPTTRALLAYASHTWTRDPQSADLLSPLAPPDGITAAADLAHLWLRAERFPAPEPDTAAYLLNFESPAAFSPTTLATLISETPAHHHRWLVQEVRDFPGTERALLPTLPDPTRAALSDVRLPPYATGSMRALVDAWGTPSTLLTSRYHGAIIGAWLGSRVLPVWRNDKLVGLSKQLSLPGLPTLTDPAATRRALASASPVPPSTLHTLATQSASACSAFLHHATTLP